MSTSETNLTVEKALNLVAILEHRIDSLKSLSNGLMYLQDELKAEIPNISNGTTTKNIDQLINSINDILARHA